MYHNTQLALVDVVRLALSGLIIYFVQRMENIKCLDTPSWKPTYMKFFSIAVIVFTVVNLAMKPMFFNVSSKLMMVLASLMSFTVMALSIVMIYAVYTYVRELEDNFKACDLSQSDLNIHEFLKFYSLIMVLLFALGVAGLISFLLVLIPFPRYTSQMPSTNMSVFKAQLIANNGHNGKSSSRKLSKRK